MKIGNNRNPKGKLYTKYFNSVRNLKTNGLIESVSTVSKDKANDNSNDCTKSTSSWTQNDFVQEKDIECILDELKHDSSSFQDLERNWKATINYRLNYIKNSSSTNDILQMWKQYLIPYGHKLIDIDYNALFPNCTNIYDEYSIKIDKLLTIMDEKIKDINCRKLLEEIKTTKDITENVSVSVRVKRSFMCHMLHRFFCTCFHQKGDEMDQITQMVRDYQTAEQILINSGRYNKKEDFTVVIQPFIKLFNAPLDKKRQFEEVIDISYVTYDCFHFSQKGHALAANLLWNNMLQPVGTKSENTMDFIMKDFVCPTVRSPYIFTANNSVPLDYRNDNRLR